MRVTDTGAGMAAEHLPHLGERFYRADPSRTRPTGGTGLGLSICRGIVDAHGGTLGFESAWRRRHGHGHAADGGFLMNPSSALVLADDGQGHAADGGF